MTSSQMIQVMITNNQPDTTPLCKCEIECYCYISWDYDTYKRRYWGCPLPISNVAQTGGEEKDNFLFSNVMNVNKYSKYHVNFVT